MATADLHLLDHAAANLPRKNEQQVHQISSSPTEMAGNYEKNYTRTARFLRSHIISAMCGQATAPSASRLTNWSQSQVHFTALGKNAT